MAFGGTGAMCQTLLAMSRVKSSSISSARSVPRRTGPGLRKTRMYSVMMFG